MGATDPGAWLLLAAATRLAAIAATLVARSRSGLSRSAAFGGSVAASLVTGGVGLFALGTRPAVAGPLDPPRGLGADPRLLGGRPLGLVPPGPGDPRHRRRRLQRRLLRPLEPGTHRLRGRRLQRAPRLGRDGLRGRRGDRLPPGLGAHDARHRGPGGDRARARADAPGRLPLPGALPRRHGLPRGRLLPPRLGRAVPRVRRHPRAASGGDALPRRRVPAVPGRLRRQGRDDPPPRLAPRGAPRGAEPDLRADVGRPDQDRDLRDLPRVRGRPGRAAARVGRPRPRRGRRLDGAGGPLRADAARPQAAARLPQHREHRHHPRRRRGRDDLARRSGSPGSRCSPWRRRSSTS